MTGPAELYLDLIARALTGMVYEDPPVPAPWLDHTDYRLTTREAGGDWPQHAPCMIGLGRLGNVRDCVEQVLADGIPGDLAEAGIWRGGTVIFMRALLKVAGDTSRSVWAIDSFAGLPPEAASEYPGWPSLAVSLPEVEHNFALYQMLDAQVKFLPGWFTDSLPDAPVRELAVLRLDADLYESQLTALTYLYPKLSPGGFCIIDDPHLAGCARAVREYREAHRITEPVKDAGPYAIWWRKEQ